MAFVDGEILTAKALNDAFTNLQDQLAKVADPNTIYIDGQAYQRSGNVAGPGPSPGWKAQAGGYVTGWTLTLPFNIPEGWGVMAQVVASNGYVFTCLSGAQTENTVGLRFFATTTTASVSRVAWQLFKL